MNPASGHRIPRLGRHAALIAGGQFGRLFIQALYFVILARALGLRDYGAFASTLALAAICVPFAGLGTTLLIVRNGAREPDRLAEHWANAKRTVFCSGAILTVALLALSPWVLPDGASVASLCAIALADLVAGRLTEVSGSVFQAAHQVRRTAHIPVWLSLSRLVGAVLLYVTPIPSTVLSWAVLYSLTSVATAFWITRLTTKVTGKASASWRQVRADAVLGFQFSVGLASQSVYNDIDKVMLARIDGVDSAGAYSAAYKIVDMATVPFRSMLSAALPTMFKLGAVDISAMRPFLVKIGRPIYAYGAVAAVGLFLGAPILPKVLGAEYGDSVAILRGLALLPLLKALHYPAGDALTCSGNHRARIAIQVGVAAINVVLNLVLIPAHGYVGAIISSLVCDGLLALALWSVILRLW
ncbi:MAG: hypothetical protein JWQ11_2769, partial [Rhizobacter sp.]|nr:hypothetical protein [Rhizobacter sp.]